MLRVRLSDSSFLHVAGDDPGRRHEKQDQGGAQDPDPEQNSRRWNMGESRVRDHAPWG